MNFIEQIPGSTFIVIYLVALIAINLFLYFSINNDETLKLELPEPSSLKPIDIAIISGGVFSAIQFTIAKLWKNNVIAIESNTLSILDESYLTSDKLEKHIIEDLRKKPKEFSHFLSQQFLRLANEALKSNFYELESKGLYYRNARKGLILPTIIAIFCGLLFGGIKLFYGIIHSKPIAILALLMIMAIVIPIMVFAKCNTKKTALGRKLLKKAKLRFDYLNNESKDTLDTNEAIFAAAIFGPTFIMPAALASFIDINPKSSSDLDTSYYDGGASCSGSGCSGGACGGCGGN